MSDQDTEIEVRLWLKCSSGSTPEGPSYRTFIIPSFPCTVLDIKKKIEAAVDIPLVLQKLRYGSVVLHDEDYLDSLRLRSGDTLQVSYYAKAECSEILLCVQWLRSVVTAFGSDRVPLMTSTELEMSDEVRRVMTIIVVHEQFMVELSFKQFLPWLSPTKYANKLFFVVNGGLEVIMQLHSQLQQVAWHLLPEKLRIVECQIFITLWNLAESFQIRRAMVHYNALKACTSSMLRVKINKRTPLYDTSHPVESHFEHILQETINAALGTLTNLAELPETHMALATNAAFIEQTYSMAQCPSFDVRSVQLVGVLFLCLSYTEGTHKFLAKPEYIEGLLSAHTEQHVEGISDDNPADAIMLYKYHIATFLSQIITFSQQLIPPALEGAIFGFLKEFLDGALPEVLRKTEIDQQYVWATFLPYIKMVYAPSRKYGVVPVDTRLSHMSTEIAILALQNMLGRDNLRSVLVKEHLLDFVTCLPWYTHGSAQRRAFDLLRMLHLAPDMPLQLPSLLNISRAVVAKEFCGLTKVLESSISDLITEVAKR